MTTPPRITLIRLTLRADTPFAVSSPESAIDEVGLPIARDAAGRPTVPASTLAGSLRHMLGANAATLMGNDPGTDDIRASRLWVLGTRVTTPAAPGTVDQPDTTRRWQTAVDRQRGAATQNTLRWTELLPTRTTITVHLRLDRGPHGDTAEDTLLQALAGWTPRLGRGVSSGYGRLHTTALTVGRLDLSRTGDLVTWLTAGGPELFDAVATEPYPLSTPDDGVWLLLRWQLAEAIQISDHAGDTAERTADGERNNLVQLHRSNGVPAMPGTSWKGVYRSRAEFILRSLGIDACLNGRCGQCPTCTLFGHGGGQPSHQSVGQRSAIAFRDSSIDNAVIEHRPHVAIDRFTGGARDTALYIDEVATAGTITQRTDALATDALRDRLPWARGLLLAVVKDLHDGLIGMGHATTRGYGTLRLLDPEQVCSPAAQTEITRALRTLLASQPSQPPEATREETQ